MRKINIKILMLSVFVLGFIGLSGLASAISMTVTPIQDSHTSIPNQNTNANCGASVQYPFSITNNGGGGVLCWYTTSDNGTPQKLTSSCVKPGQTQAYNVNMQMPSSTTTKTVTVQLECYDFWNAFGNPQDTCKSEYDLSQARQYKYSGGGAGSFAPRYFDLSCTLAQFTITSSKSYVSLLNGQSETVSITIYNSMAQSISCDKNLGNILSGSSKSYSITLQAPATGSGTTTQTETVTCTSSQSSASQSSVITLNYQSDPCVAALNSAKGSINDTEATIANAQVKMKEASDLGTDTTSSQTSLNQANTKLQSAKTQLSTAQTTCNAGDKTNGPTQANTAKTSADDANFYATQALNAAQQSITAFTQMKTEAQNKISDANSAITNAVIVINRANDILINATVLYDAMPEALGGLDLVAQKSNVKTAEAKIDQAKQYGNDAQAAFEKKNFDSAKSKAESSLQLSADANYRATDSYTRINNVMGTLGEAAKAILSASSEIKQTDDTLTKMSFVIKNVEKWKVDLSDAKDIVSSGQTNIDTAKDLLSQAKIRLQAGASADAVAKAIAARDKAAEPTNRLNRIVSSLSEKTKDALDKAHEDATKKVDASENSVKEASNTYMATQTEVTKAQNELVIAKAQLVNASDSINQVKSAEDLTTLLSKASTAFSALDNAGDKVESVVTHANAAKSGLYAAAGTAAAVLAGAGGAGFLYWRGKKKSGKHRETRDDKEEKRGLCNKCDAKLDKHHKFCPSCGAKN